MDAALLPPEFFWTVLVKFAVAVVCGGVIGLERQLRGKPAGIRTCIVLVVTTTFMAGLGGELTAEIGDPSRVLAAIRGTSPYRTSTRSMSSICGIACITA